MTKSVTGPLLIASNLPLNVSFDSIPIPFKTIDIASFIITTSGATTSSGNFKVFARNGSSAWVDIGISPTIILSNADRQEVLALSDVSVSEILLRYTRGTVGDSGTFTAWFQGEGVS